MLDFKKKIESLFSFIAIELKNLKVGYVEGWVDLTETLISNRGTWVAPANGLITYRITGPNNGQVSYFYLWDDTDDLYVIQNLATGGGSAAGQVIVFKGHEYKILAKDNLDGNSYIKFKAKLGG